MKQTPLFPIHPEFPQVYGKPRYLTTWVYSENVACFAISGSAYG